MEEGDEEKIKEEEIRKAYEEGLRIVYKYYKTPVNEEKKYTLWIANGM